MEIFEKLYKANIDDVCKAVADSLVMCGSSNWDFYFEKKPRNTDFEELSNVALFEFENKTEFDKFLSAGTFIDYSLEHNKPCALIYG